MTDGRNWGSDIISSDKWIDLSKTYQTRDGRDVKLHAITLRNAAGAEVTYPVKGIILNPLHPRRKIHSLWTLDGRADVAFPKPNLDLVEVTSDQEKT